MQKIIPHLWFNTNAEEAVAFYLSAFKDGSIKHKTYYPEAGHEVHGMEAGTVLTVDFEIEGHAFTALNGGPHFTPNPSISFMVACSSAEDVDALWATLSEGGTRLMPLDAYPFSDRFGWVQDKFGISWQVMLVDANEIRQTITPMLLFVGDNAGNAEDAVQFYTSLFDNSSIDTMQYYGEDQAPDTPGTVMQASFTLNGQRFAAMDSAHEHLFAFNEAISLLVLCETQEEIDVLWNALSAKPEAEQCGWLKDRYGVSWQIVPQGMDAMLRDPNADKANRAMEAMLKMKKIDIAQITRAYEGS